jgi:hypothetical protein
MYYKIFFVLSICFILAQRGLGSALDHPQMANCQEDCGGVFFPLISSNDDQPSSENSDTPNNQIPAGLAAANLAGFGGAFCVNTDLQLIAEKQNLENLESFSTEMQVFASYLFLRIQVQKKSWQEVNLGLDEKVLDKLNEVLTRAEFEIEWDLITNVKAVAMAIKCLQGVFGITERDHRRGLGGLYGDAYRKLGMHIAERLKVRWEPSINWLMDQRWKEINDKKAQRIDWAKAQSQLVYLNLLKVRWTFQPDNKITFDVY